MKMLKSSVRAVSFLMIFALDIIISNDIYYTYTLRRKSARRAGRRREQAGSGRKATACRFQTGKSEGKEGLVADVLEPGCNRLLFADSGRLLDASAADGDAGALLVKVKLHPGHDLNALALFRCHVNITPFTINSHTYRRDQDRERAHRPRIPGYTFHFRRG